MAVALKVLDDREAPLQGQHIPVLALSNSLCGRVSLSQLKTSHQVVRCPTFVHV